MIKIVRLTSGDLICGEVQEVDNKVLVNRPLFIMVRLEGAAFVPLMEMISDDTTFEIREASQNVLAMLNPSKEVLAKYNEHFSNIKVPEKAKLIY